MNDDIMPPEPRRSTITNPFGGGGVAIRPSGALAQAEQQKVVAEVQARIMVARSFPRDPIKAMDLILIDCTRPTLAKKALYEYARGGTAISGPSIRLAEAIAQRWGNIASGVKEISRANGYSECVAYAFDMESGFYDERQFQVRHWRDTKQGGYQLTDERDIYEIISNNGARRKRAAMLTVIPGDVVEAAVEQCEETLRATADTSPDALLRMVEAFEQFDVTREQIEKRIQRRIEAIRPAQVIQLSKIFASLTDGMSAPADWFEAEGAATGGIWGAVEQAHGNAVQMQPAAPSTGQTRRAPRKASAKKSASQRATETAPQGGDPNVTSAESQVGGEAPLPPAASYQGTNQSSATSASAGHVPEGAGAAMETSAPATQTTNSAGAAFSAWLIDGDGMALADEVFTDPVAFATAYATTYTDMFPPERKSFERANAESVEAAHRLNPVGVEAALAPPKQNAPPPVSEARVATELPMDLPHDPAVIPRPAKPTRMAVAAFLQALRDRVKDATEAQLDHIGSVNDDTIAGLPNAFREEAIEVLEARREQLATPPPTTAARTSPNLVDGLIDDVGSLTTAESVTTWLAMPRIAAHIANIEATDRPGWIRLMSAANSAYVRMRVLACDTQAACEVVEDDQAVNRAMEWLHGNNGREFDAIVALARSHKDTLSA